MRQHREAFFVDERVSADPLVTVQGLFDQLLSTYGEQHWWPAQTPFEMMVGAILTQNTSWQNVERAIAGLRHAGLLEPDALAAAAVDGIEQSIRPAGYFRQKTQRLQLLARFYLDQGGVEAMCRVPLPEMRARLLALHGVGPETADSILLYALNRPLFVIDTYTKRLMQRLGLVVENPRYDALQGYFHQRLPADVALFQEFHALIVAHGKTHCAARPSCSGCVLGQVCREGVRQVS